MADAQIFADLKADHDRQRTLLAQIEDASDPGERADLFDQLKIELMAHAAAEEESLYATMLANPDLRDDARHSVSEHKEVDDLLGELVETDVDSDEWTAKFGELKHRYEHHIDEEEEEMFPTATQHLSSAEEDRLATVFEARKPEELERAKEESPGDSRD